MATDADHFHHNTNCNSWSPSENQNLQAVSVSGILDHGSISFGRFAAESLSWEKWSVFSHNRCQEELEKFKAPGFVAQKKAYFEEHYKRIRALRASQAEQQETTRPSLKQDVNSHITQVESCNDAALTKGKNKPSYVRQIQILDYDSSAESNSSLESIVQKQEPVTKEIMSNNNESASIKDAAGKSLCASEPDQSMKVTSSLQTPVTRNSEISQHEGLVSNSAKLMANKPKTQGNVASTGNKTKLGNRSTKEGIKLSEKIKPSPDDRITVKANSRIVVGKCSSLKAETGNISIHASSHKKLTEACSSSTVCASLTRNRLESSSSSGKTSQTKANSNRRDIVDKVPRRLPGYRQSAQCSLKETVSGGLGQKGTDNRYHFITKKHILYFLLCLFVYFRTEPFACSWNAARVLQMNLMVEVMANTRLRNLHSRNKLKQNSSVDLSQRSYDRERRQKEGEAKSDKTIGRGPKSVTTTPSSNQNNSKLVQKGEAKSDRTIGRGPKSATTTPSSSRNNKLVQKNTTSQLTKLPHAQKEPRLKMPSWR